MLAPVRIDGHELQPRDEIHARKLEALRVFVQHLLNSPARDQIAKIILFGSVARGEARAESDIDVMVYGLGDLNKVRESVYDAAFESGVKLGQGLEPMVEDVFELFEPSDYFNYAVLERGEEAYAMPEEKLRRAENRELLGLAQVYLESAQFAMDGKQWRAAADLAYNAAELCIKALLNLKLEQIPSSHGGLVDKFGELYIKDGPLSREFGRRVRQGLEIRSHARYRPSAEITSDKVKHNVLLAQELVTYLQEKLGE